MKLRDSVVDMKIATKVFVLFLVMAGICRAGCCRKSLSGEKLKADSVEEILTQLSESSGELRSYEGRVEYLFSQPLFESQTLRKGMLYYQRCEKTSKLRINFETLKQDDEKEQKHIEELIFDGQWLTVIDYQLKEVKKHQLAEANEPVDAFELARGNFPIIGFGESEDLKKEFEIELVDEQEKGGDDFIQLHLKVKPNSVYKDDYISIDFWIDKGLFLPGKIVALSTEEDIYQIELLGAKVNEGIDEEVFEFAVPAGFGEPEIIPLKKKVGRK